MGFTLKGYHPRRAAASGYSPISTEPALPSLQDELDFYTAQGWDQWAADSTRFGVSAGAAVSLAFTPDFRKTCPEGGDPFDITADPGIHGDPEGDDLWTYLHQEVRHGNAEYGCFADAWATFWKTDRLTSANYASDLSVFGGDHLTAWGLITLHELTGGDATAVAAAAAIVADCKAWWVANKGDGTNMPVPGAFNMTSVQPRTGARLLYSATRLAEATGDADDIAFRDRMIDLWLQSTGWEDKTVSGKSGGMHVLDQAATDSADRAGTGAYAAGYRIIQSFHMGILADAYFHAHRTITDTTKQAAIRAQIIKMGYWCQEYGLTDTCEFTGKSFGFDGSGVKWHASQDCNAAGNDPVYTLSLVNLFVIAYKWSGDATFLASAIKHFQQGTKYKIGAYPANAIAGVGELHHFVDTQWASATSFKYLSHNKGELQYVARLFENGGSPTIDYNASPLPSWLTGATDKTWIAVGSNTFASVDPVTAYDGWSFGGGATYHTSLVDFWNGGIARDDYLVLPFCGGHNGSSQNTVYEFGPFTSETPSWNWYGTDTAKYDFPSHVGSPDASITDWTLEYGLAYYSDGKPSSRHTYDHICYIPDLGGGVGRVAFAPFGYSPFNPDNGGTRVYDAASFKFTSESDVGGTYEARDTYTDWPGNLPGPGGGVEFDSVKNLVWCASTVGSDSLYSFNPVTNTYSKHNVSSPDLGNDTGGFTIDPIRRIAIVHSAGVGLIVWDLDIDNGKAGAFVTITTNYTGALKTADNIGLEYEPIGQKFVGYDGGATLYTMTPPADYRDGNGDLDATKSWTWVEVTNGAGGATPTAAAGNGTYGRFRYIPSISSFAVFNNSGDASVYVYKVPAAGL